MESEILSWKYAGSKPGLNDKKKHKVIPVIEVIVEKRV